MHRPETVVKYIDPRKELALRVFRYILVRHFGKAHLSRVFQRTGRYGWNVAFNIQNISKLGNTHREALINKSR